MTNNTYEKNYPPTPSPIGTFVFLVGLFASYTVIPEAKIPEFMAKDVATIIGISLLLSIYFDSQKGLINLFRTDLLCLVGIYGITFLEFLFPQEQFNNVMTVAQTGKAITVIIVGMGSLAIGRHLITPKPIQSKWLNFSDISNESLFWIYVYAGFLGYLNMLLAVNFNIMDMIHAMLGPRMSVPWGRGRLGDAKALISELSLLLYILPPLTGVIWNRRASFPFFKLVIVLLIFALTIFQGFSMGTRNVFIAYLATLLMGYLMTLKRNNFINTVIPTFIIAFLVVYGSYHMLEFRNIGLESYLENKVYAGNTVRNTLSIDYNLYSIGLIADTLPEKHSYLGTEILIWAIVKPIPRVFFPGKPEGLSESIESIVGAGPGYTVAATYIGESYIMAGYFGVIGTSLFLGALAAWWNRLALQKQSDYAMVVYSLGFFTAAITMRSMFWLTTCTLPVIALIFLKKIGFAR